MNLCKEVDEIYQKGILFDNDEFVCSVCGKRYKRLSTAENHIQKQTCHSYRNVFEGSPVETLLFSMYKKGCYIENKRPTTFSKFRRSGDYTRYAKFYVFCVNNNIKSTDTFFEFILEITKTNSVRKALSIEAKQSNVSLFYRHLQKNNHLIDSETFYLSNEDFLKSDTSFALRSLERGDIGFEYLFDKIDAVEFYESLSEIQKKRFDEVFFTSRPKKYFDWTSDESI